MRGKSLAKRTLQLYHCKPMLLGRLRRGLAVGMGPSEPRLSPAAHAAVEANAYSFGRLRWNESITARSH